MLYYHGNGTYKTYASTANLYIPFIHFLESGVDIGKR